MISDAVQKASDAASEPSSGARARQLTVAIVDDDEGQRYATTRFLREAKFAVIEASSGAEALAVARTLPDVIVLDVSLPDIDGFEVCRRIKEDPKTASVLVVQTSAVFREGNDRVRGLEGGADAYIVQPVKMTELVATIRAVLRIRQYEMEQVRLLAREQEARRAAEAAEHRVALLADVSVLLAATLDYRNALEALADRLVGELADGVVIELVDRNQHWSKARIRWREPDREAQARMLIGAPEREGAPFEPEVLVRPLGVCSVLSLAMTSAPDRLLGRITLLSSSREFRVDDRLLAEDIARRASIAVERALLFEDARSAVDARDQILSIVSHDLRNPLGALMLGADVLLRKLPKDEAGLQLRARVERGIVRQAARMQTLLDDLTDVSAIETGQLSIEKEPADLARSIAELRDGFEVSAAAKNIRLEFELPTSAVLAIDKKRIGQAFANILQNAINYTQAGGKVLVKLSSGPDGATRLSIEDNGPGIERVHLHRVFDRNWRGASSSGQSGSGLGLFITKGIVAAHGARIEVDSVVGRGTRFTIIFRDVTISA